MNENNKILEMLDLNNDSAIQEKGIAEAEKIPDFSFLFRPTYPGKNVWQNCAKVICKKSDEELDSYLTNMFEWLEEEKYCFRNDGCMIICERLRKIEPQLLKIPLEKALKKALAEKNFRLLDSCCVFLSYDNPVVEKIIDPKLLQKIDDLYDILGGLSWDCTEKEVQQSITKINQWQDYSPLFQPLYKTGKAVWDNCALIIVSKSDQELEPYLVNMLMWIRDLKWPGAELTMQRLTNFDYKKLLPVFEKIVDESISLREYDWLYWLSMLLEDNDGLKKHIKKEQSDFFKSFDFDNY